MNISNIKIRSIFAEGPLKAIISVVIDECLAVHEIKVVQGNDRLFVAMPSRKDESGIYRDIIHPLDSNTREEFERVILNAYDNYIKVEEIFNSED